jgi:hypothetical protein
VGVRAKLLAFWLLVAAAAGVALWCHWPFLAREHARLEPWKSVLVWSSDAVAALAFVWFGLTYLLLGRPLPVGPDPGGRFDCGHVLLIAAFALSLGCDGLVSWWIVADEEAARARAQVAVGEIVGCRRPTRAGNTWLHCRFTDARGDCYDAELAVGGLGEPEAARRLRLGLFPIPVRIAYDPDWPDRNWLQELRAQRGDTLHDMSLVLVLVQVLVCLPRVVLGVCNWQTPEGVIPLYTILPFLVNVGTLFTVGLFMRFLQDVP